MNNTLDYQCLIFFYAIGYGVGLFKKSASVIISFIPFSFTSLVLDRKLTQSLAKGIYAVGIKKCRVGVTLLGYVIGYVVQILNGSFLKKNRQVGSYFHFVLNRSWVSALASSIGRWNVLCSASMADCSISSSVAGRPGRTQSREVRGDGILSSTNNTPFTSFNACKGLLSAMVSSRVTSKVRMALDFTSSKCTKNENCSSSRYTAILRSIKKPAFISLSSAKRKTCHVNLVSSVKRSDFINTWFTRKWLVFINFKRQYLHFFTHQLVGKFDGELFLLRHNDSSIHNNGLLPKILRNKQDKQAVFCCTTLEAL